MPCRAQRSAVLLNAATRGGLHCARLCAHARTSHACARPSAARPSRTTGLPSGPDPFTVSRCAPDAPVAAVGFARASPTCKLCRLALSPGVAVLPSRFGLAGRGSRGQPSAARCGALALRPPSVRTARRGSRPGTLSGTKAEGTPGVLTGYPRGIPLPESTRGTGCTEECSAAVGRARLPSCRLENACSFDLMCRCRGSSCS